MSTEQEKYAGFIIREQDKVIHKAVKEIFAIANPVLDIVFVEENSPQYSGALDGINEILFCDNTPEARLKLLVAIGDFINKELNILSVSVRKDRRISELNLKCQSILDKAYKDITTIDNFF